MEKISEMKKSVNDIEQVYFDTHHWGLGKSPSSTNPFLRFFEQ
jgi:hypothetical protein